MWIDLSPSLTDGWLIKIAVVQHVWRRVNEEKKFKFLETRNLNRVDLEKTFGVIHLHCGSNSNPSVGQFVGALKTVTIAFLIEVFLTETVRIMLPLFWTICIPFSSHPVFLHALSWQVMTGRPLTMFCTLLMRTKHRKGSSQPFVLVL